ncbi:MAG: PSD1 and planctomycete cytochrome C domain-containing protein [Pirellulaceae bacterium]|jgi:hypothetical protein|nr:PSD1 and planctomycete cytochrome C domain-containing protein [Pirellulaceae bacterium]MDP7014546.1 PSD1 and planctomycete cytochrome C domain-containing protein [Pirellulaceae bacterium]
MSAPNRISFRPNERLIVAALAALSLLASTAAAKEPTPQELDFFERRIRPALIEHCYECHSSKAEKIKGGLNLGSREGLRRGGETGAAIVPGAPRKSLLLEAIRYESLEMPPKGKLAAGVAADFAKWIEMGAPDPRSATATTKAQPTDYPVRAEDLWSLQPVRAVEPPTVSGVEFPIDRFIREKLSDAGLPAAGPAADRVLLRRLFVELTGLPPATTDYEAFAEAVSTNRERAIESIVDRLLASPEYGERWARHWLDLTAYADTVGVGRAIPALEAWRYRDYVIDAFNSDKPFDVFAREQIAGDITVPPAPGSPGGAPPTAAQIIATGFLAIGPWELVNGDKVQLRMDVVDKQVHRVGQAFLALTLGCARCHDHKFDPVQQRDYYGLAGMFKNTVTLSGREGGVFSALNERVLPESAGELLARAQRVKAYEDDVARHADAREAANARVAKLKSDIEATKDKDKKAELEKQRAAAAAKAAKHATRLAVLKYLRDHRTQALSTALADGPEPEDCRINIRGNAHQLGDVVPRSFVAAVAPTETPAWTRGGSGRLQLAEWITDKRNPLTARVWVNRVWHHLFGAGIVRTVDNFGSRGESPSHPGLLDHLSTDFVAQGWSTKKLVKRIVMSETWRQASTNSAAAEIGADRIDPENRLLWRSHRRRLEAESIRDSMLFVSGQLNIHRGGPTLPLDEPGNLSTSLTGSLRANAKLSSDLKRRRAVYLPAKRKAPFDEIDFLGAFDLPDPSQETGRRSTTMVPTQALYLLNSPFVMQCATAIAKREATKSTDPHGRVEDIYAAVLGRAPSDDDVNEALQFVQDLRGDVAATPEATVDELAGWARLSQSLLISNEFLFRD